jgi:hypothetical protein
MIITAKKWKAHTFRTVMEAYENGTIDNASLAFMLLVTHDSYGPAHWADQLLNVARIYDLDDSIVRNFVKFKRGISDIAATAPASAEVGVAA